ncbi:MAG: efflux RND transporter periplasmic adaptor subunit [Bacteroidales bacterium]|nr:efflux RND transporter periplasmic adaptor subunit [Bacteroidales bacterium]
MRPLSRFTMGLLIAVILLLSCGGPAPENAETVSSPEPGRVVLTAEQAKRAGIELGSIREVLLSHDVNASGKLVLPAGRTASVHLPMGGIIRQIHVKTGQHVRYGEVLASCTDISMIKIQEDYLKARAILDMTSKEYNRQEELAGNNISAARQLEIAGGDYKQALATYHSLESQVRLLGINIDRLNNSEIIPEIPLISPINGRVAEINIRLGQFVTPETEAFEIIDISELMAEIFVFEKDIDAVAPGQRITFTIGSLPGPEKEGKVITTGSRVEPEGRVIRVVASISKAHEGLLPGMFVSSTIHTGEQMLTALPGEAIIMDESGQAFAYYTTSKSNDPEMIFQRINLTTGFDEGGFVHVTPAMPLPENARIAVKGSYYIYSQMLKNAGD